jgi:hypothetical protein
VDIHFVWDTGIWYLFQLFDSFVISIIYIYYKFLSSFSIRLIYKILISYYCIMMNSQDAEENEERLDDMGVLVLSDECHQIEEVVRIFKYLTFFVIVVVIGVVIYIFV